MLTNDNKQYQVDFTIEELEKSLDPKVFFRAKRKFFVNFAAVSKVSPELIAKLKISLAPTAQEEVIISREKARESRHWLGE